jgi:hypothetical protein
MTCKDMVLETRVRKQNSVAYSTRIILWTKGKLLGNIKFMLQVISSLQKSAINHSITICIQQIYY